MEIQPSDRISPASVGLVSRAWIIREVNRHAADPALQRRWVEQLSVYEPPRRNGLRNSFIFWLTALGAATLAGAIGVAPWLGFVAALTVFIGVARLLAVRALQWRLRQLVAEAHGAPPNVEH